LAEGFEVVGVVAAGFVSGGSIGGGARLEVHPGGSVIGPRFGVVAVHRVSDRIEEEPVADLCII
jgi:hypothetical protein